MDENTLRKEALARLTSFIKICREIISRSISLSSNPRAVPADSTALAKYTARLTKENTPILAMLNNYAKFFAVHREKILNIEEISRYLDDVKAVSCWMSQLCNDQPLQIFFFEGKPQFGFIDLMKIYERAATIKRLAIQALEVNPDNVTVEDRGEDITYLYRLYRLFELALPDSDDKEQVKKIIELITESVNDDAPTTTSSSTQMPPAFGNLGALFAGLSTGDLSGLKSMATQLGMKESLVDTVTSSLQQSLEAIQNNQPVGNIIDSTVASLKQDPDCQRYVEMASNLKEELNKDAATPPESSSAVTEMIENDTA